MVYVVIGGWDYAGEDSDSIRLFVSRASAERYRDVLVEPDPTFERSVYDYVEIVERSVED